MQVGWGKGELLCIIPIIILLPHVKTHINTVCDRVIWDNAIHNKGAIKTTSLFQKNHDISVCFFF